MEGVWLTLATRVDTWLLYRNAVMQLCNAENAKNAHSQHTIFTCKCTCIPGKLPRSSCSQFEVLRIDHIIHKPQSQRCIVLQELLTTVKFQLKTS